MTEHERTDRETQMHEAAERLIAAIGRPDLIAPKMTDQRDEGYARLLEIFTATVEWIKTNATVRLIPNVMSYGDNLSVGYEITPRTTDL